MSRVVASSPVPSEKADRARSRHLAPLTHPPSRWLTWCLLASFCGYLFFYGLTSGELYRTENLRAIVAAEFLRTGNWIVPMLYGEPLFTKPPGMYAAVALVSLPFGGVNEWTARLPSALAATLTVFLFYWYFSRQLGRLAGLLAALILPMSLMWLDKVPAAEIDMLQVFWVSASILFFLRALEAFEDRESSIENRERRIETSRAMEDEHRFSIVDFRSSILDPRSSILDLRSSAGSWWLPALLCVTGGFLTKWTAPAFFYGMVIPMLWRRGQLRLLWGRHHLLSAAVAAAICLTWAGAAVAMTSWHELYGTVSREGLMRLSPSHHHRAYPWKESLVHPLRLLAASLPNSAFALLALRPGFSRLWDRRGRFMLQALHCWTWPNLLFWSVIPEHAARHSFPLFPGLAGLAAMVWLTWLRGIRRPDLRGAIVPLRRMSALGPMRWFVLMIVSWLIVKLVFVQVILPHRNPTRQPKEKGEQIAALVPEGKTLFLFRLKDEGIMFYYGREVKRLGSPAQLPSSPEPIYCILDESEWQTWNPEVAIDVLLRLPDEQGDPIVLVKVHKV
jgi:4-amino-4-deoxy-L-arabinose transferase-like glycosyltransferase